MGKKPLGIILVIISAFLLLAACSKALPTNVGNPSAEPSDNSNDNQDNVKDYGIIGAQLIDNTVKAMIGGYTMDDVEQFLGMPEKAGIENINGTVRWHYKQGIEMDFISVNDEDVLLYNYIYLDPSSSVKTDRNIGIGSTRDEVMSAYAEEINPDNIADHKIIAGDSGMGIVFILDNNKVTEIYIATGAYTHAAREIPN